MSRVYLEIKDDDEQLVVTGSSAILADVLLQAYDHLRAIARRPQSAESPDASDIVTHAPAEPVTGNKNAGAAGPATP